MEGGVAGRVKPIGGAYSTVLHYPMSNGRCASPVLLPSEGGGKCQRRSGHIMKGTARGKRSRRPPKWPPMRQAQVEESPTESNPAKQSAGWIRSGATTCRNASWTNLCRAQNGVLTRARVGCCAWGKAPWKETHHPELWKVRLRRLGWPVDK